MSYFKDIGQTSVHATDLIRKCKEIQYVRIEKHAVFNTMLKNVSEIVPLSGFCFRRARVVWGRAESTFWGSRGRMEQNPGLFQQTLELNILYPCKRLVNHRQFPVVNVGYSEDTPYHLPPRWCFVEFIAIIYINHLSTKVENNYVFASNITSLSSIISAAIFYHLHLYRCIHVSAFVVPLTRLSSPSHTQTLHVYHQPSPTPLPYYSGYWWRCTGHT